MGTAVVHVTDVPGYGDVATCYQLDPPLVSPLTDTSHEYVTAYRMGRVANHQLAQVTLVASDDKGACVTPTLKPLARYSSPVGEPTFETLLGLAGYTVAAP